MIGQTVSHYKIVEKLGGGGMGVVYKAEDTKLGRFVALKFLPEAVAQDRQAVDRFMLEARAAAALSHPHICTIHEIDEHEGVPFIAMEYLEGQNLKYAIGGRPMAVEIIVELGLQITEALAAAHAKGITHRDIKPSNIFLVVGGKAKVVDFGLAKLAPQVIPGSEDETIVADAPTQTADLTDDGIAMGTVSYMSPEQALGQEVDARTDLFSLGALLYEMTTGRQAFVGSTQAAIFDKILNRQPPSPLRLGIEIPYELEQVINKSLEKNKALRYQSALEVHTDLRRIRRDIESGQSAAVTAADPSMLEEETASVAVPPISRPISRAASGAIPVAVQDEIPTTAVAVPALHHRKGPLLWILTGLLIVAAAVIAVLVLRRPEAPVLAESDVLLLTDFGNTTGDPVFDGTLKQAVAVKLDESPYLNILPERQVQETLRFMGRATDERVTSEIGQEICERLAIKALVTGEIASLGTNYVITLMALECRTGNSLARQQVEAASKEGVLGAVGEAVVAIRQSLGESLASIEKFDAPVEQATTTSLEALRVFGLGAETRTRGREEDAIPMFKRALELDPDFALAHARLGSIYANHQEWDNAIYHKSRAFALRDRVNEKERLYITGHYYGTVTGEINKETEAYETFKQAYPRDWTPANNLCSNYNDYGWHEKALEEGQLALRLGPDEPLPYTNLATAYMNLNRFEEAKKVLDDARTRGFLRHGVFTGRYQIAYLEGDTGMMDEMAAALAGTRGEADITVFEAEIAASQGRLEEAERLYRRAVEITRSFGFEEQAAVLMAEGAYSEAAFGNFDRAAERASQAMEGARNRDSMRVAAIAFGLAGAIAEAEALIAELGERFPADTLINSVWIPLARASIDMHRQNPEAMIEHLEVVTPFERGNLVAIYLRGRAFLLAERPEDARAEYEKLLGLRGVRPTRPVHTLAHLGMGRALAASGDIVGARREYEIFLDLVRNGDDGLPTIEAARDEYPSVQ